MKITVCVDNRAPSFPGHSGYFPGDGYEDMHIVNGGHKCMALRQVNLFKLTHKLS